MISVKYFGAIAEKTKTLEEDFSFSEMSLNDLLLALEQKYDWSQLSFSVAVNQKIVQVQSNYILKNNDVIALLPPFSGG
ncbi:MoaD/ThiS family protein [Flavobacterium sp.]|uniref:MoaD/ThiS family protein n=1 Tax=Flavobacterium sp. TaxID=239 RepID=UPI00286D636C|nr:MoaD/ThiS family protein [Flavobacterium sp.]